MTWMHLSRCKKWEGGGQIRHQNMGREQIGKRKSNDHPAPPLQPYFLAENQSDSYWCEKRTFSATSYFLRWGWGESGLYSWLTSSQSVFHVCKYISFFQKYGGKMEGLAERGLRCIPVDLISICFPGGLSSKDKPSTHFFQWHIWVSASGAFYLCGRGR